MFLLALALSLSLAAPQKPAQKAVDVGYDNLVNRLENRDPVIRREACKLLGELGDRRAVQPLGKMIKDLDEETRFRAVESLGSLMNRDTVPFLTDATRDPSRRVKLGAIEGLVTLYFAPPPGSSGITGSITGVFHHAIDLF